MITGIPSLEMPEKTLWSLFNRKAIQKFFRFDYNNEIILHAQSAIFRWIWSIRRTYNLWKWILFCLLMSLVESCGAMWSKRKDGVFDSRNRVEDRILKKTLIKSIGHAIWSCFAGLNSCISLHNQLFTQWIKLLPKLLSHYPKDISIKQAFWYKTCLKPIPCLPLIILHHKLWKVDSPIPTTLVLHLGILENLT